MSPGNSKQTLSSLPKKLRKLSLQLALLILLIIPLGYGFISYKYQAIQLKQSAEQISFAISKFAHIHPLDWDLQVHRFEHIVHGLRPTNIDAQITIQDQKENIFFDTTEHPISFCFSQYSDIQGRQGKVGKVILLASLEQTIYEILILALITVFVVGVFFRRLNRYSIQGIENATTQIHNAQQDVEQQKLYLNGILDSSEGFAILGTDQHWKIKYFNPAAQQLFSFNNTELTGLSILSLDKNLETIIKQRQSKDYTEGAQKYQFSFTLDREGQTRHVDIQICKLISSYHTMSGYTLICNDVTEKHRSAALIQHQALYDSLTELPNRRLLKERLNKAIATGKRHDHLGALLFMDLDNFKNINDSLGHATGDEMLQQVSMRMKFCVRDEDTVARLGGDEFVILLPEVAENLDNVINNVQDFAEKVRSQISAPYEINSHTLHVTPSIGISIFPNDDSTPDAIIQQADTAMYRAKEDGRNAFKFFLPSMQHASERKLKILSDLQKGLDRSEFIVFFQPQLDSEQTVIGAEALIRWKHPTQGLVSPNDFIPVAEESNLIIELGNFVLHSALTIVQNWILSGIVPSSFSISINISPRQFKQAQFVDSIKQVLKETQINPCCVTLEITEGVLLEDISSAIDKIQMLNKMGVRFSIDDFGTGYSSLAYLKQLPVNEVKIDKTFINDVLQDDSDAALVETILNLTSRLHYESVAEGVETQEQYNYLKENGCHIYQGFFFSKPLEPTEFEDFIVNINV